MEQVYWYDMLRTVNDNFAELQAEITALKARVTELENA